MPRWPNWCARAAWRPCSHRPTADRERADLARARIERVRDLLQARGRSEAYLRARRNLAWLTVGSDARIVRSSESGEAAIHIGPETAEIITTTTEADRLRDEDLAGMDLPIVASPWYEPRSAPEGAATDADLEDELRRVRSRLAPLEHERMRWLGATAGAAMFETLGSVRPGQTELAIAARLGATLAERDVGTAVLLVAADERIERYRHQLPTAKAAERAVMVVVVAERWGLHAATTGTLSLSSPSLAARRELAAVRQIESVMHERTRAGAHLRDVFDAARHAYADAGYPDEWRRLHLGGTIGYQPREVVASFHDDDLIENGMAFAWNPSLGAAKVEDTLLLTANGQELVTRGPAGN
jgi:Xaa-Pro dipeptidase